ncbi:hypothetical protein B0T10DRAFT_491479 [Thelonectria olida]|uniref:Uncharacterized protein n=1 Tax=Thelonectria olida TaxID=1576542 RepID=A0A9P8W2A1_9HYPO|nr:hypothetical protein B0T10DRAFT_491479 [Thelonectria olida]
MRACLLLAAAAEAASSRRLSCLCPESFLLPRRPDHMKPTGEAEEQDKRALGMGPGLHGRGRMDGGDETTPYATQCQEPIDKCS